MKPIVVRIESPAMEEFIRVVDKIAGTWYKPVAKRKMADAKAYEIETLARAEGKASLIKDGTDTEIRERAAKRFVAEQITYQKNIEAAIDELPKYLEGSEPTGPIDEYFTANWLEGIKLVSEVDIRDMCCRLMASKIKDNTSVGIKTLRLLSEMGKREADLFEHACAISANDTWILSLLPFQKYGLGYDDIMTLQVYGLIHTSSGGQTWGTPQEPAEFGSLVYGEYEIRFKKTRWKRIGEGKYKYRYFLHAYQFTPQGSELSKILNVQPNYQYVEEVKKFLISKGYSVTTADLRTN
jgi:hypothetical protein